MRITLIVGEWPLMMKLTISVAAVSDDTLARNLWYLRALPVLAHEVKADVIRMAFPVPMRRSSYKCPAVVSLHDLLPYDEPNDLGFPNLFCNRVVLQQCLKESDGVIGVTETTLSRSKGRFPRFAHRKASVIYNTTLESSDPRPPIEGRSLYILLTGHNNNETLLTVIKAFDYLLQIKKIAPDMSLAVMEVHVCSALMGPPRKVENCERFASVDVARQYAAHYKQLIDAAGQPRYE